MTDSPDRFPWEHDDSLLGPAVPQEDAAPADDALPEPLSPFLGGDAPVSNNSHPAFSADDEPAGAEEIPWLEDLQPEPTATAFDGPPAMPTGSEPELPTMDAFLASPDGDAMSGGEDSPFDSPFSGMDVPPAEPPAASDSVFAPGGNAAGDVASAEAAVDTDAVASAASNVADRLERIARALRSGDPGRLLTSASDPLEMLVVGYVLGCSGSGRSDR